MYKISKKEQKMTIIIFIKIEWIECSIW